MLFSSPILYILIFAFTLIFTAVTTAKIIPVFGKNAKQPIYEGGPAWHSKKSGTPTMGGIAFVIPVTVVGFLFCIPLHLIGNKESAISLFLSTAFALINSLIGLLDDLTKLKHKENKGLSAREKFFLQLTATVFFLFAKSMLTEVDTSVSFFFGRIDLGVFYYPIVGFILLGIINSANLTDGIDGIAAGVAFAASISLFYASYMISAESTLLSAAIIGAAVGFLLFNIHPAKIFMGDTGSLFLGSVIASSALALGNPFILLGVGGVYVIEGTSVVIQVLVYKFTGKRVFKMAPIHHHLEKCGFGENKICIIAILSTLILSLLAFSICTVC